LKIRTKINSIRIRGDTYGSDGKNGKERVRFVMEGGKKV